MSEELLAANLDRGTPTNLEPRPANPDLEAAILDVLRDLRSPTKEFVKSKRIAAELDQDASSVEVGHQMGRLADREDAPVEEWCRGNGSRTWRILMEVDG